MTRCSGRIFDSFDFRRISEIPFATIALFIGRIHTLWFVAI